MSNGISSTGSSQAPARNCEDEFTRLEARIAVLENEVTRLKDEATLEMRPAVLHHKVFALVRDSLGRVPKTLRHF
ncbi:hypothetical protein BT69DRAFT_1283817, partial [Atractiella rhizophila]